MRKRRRIFPDLNKRKWKWLVVTGAILVWGITICGCTSLFEYKVDLAAQRQKNLETDLAFFKPEKENLLTEPLTLDGAIRLGLENNLDIRVSRIMTEIADDTRVAEKLKMLPQLNTEGDVSWRSKFLRKRYIDPDTGEETISSSVSQDKTQKTLSLSVSWNILDFGLSYIRARQAALNAEVRQMEERRQAQTLAMDIAAAYWASILAERDLAYIREIESNVREYKAKANAMVAQRRLDPISVKEMESQLVRLTLSASNLQADLSDMRIELCKLMGLTPTTSFDLSDKENFQKYADLLPDSRLLDAESLEMISLKNRPELFSADLEEKIRQHEARSVLVSMFPSISFESAYNYNADSFLVDNTWTNVTSGFVLNLLSLPSKYVEWKAKGKAVTMSRLQRLLLTAGIIAQVHVALQDYRNKEVHFNLQDNAYMITEDLLRMSRERNEAGMVGFSDTVVTQRMMESMLARLERDRSLVALFNAYNMLLATLGLDYSQWQEGLMVSGHS